MARVHTTTSLGNRATTPHASARPAAIQHILTLYRKDDADCSTRCLDTELSENLGDAVEARVSAGQNVSISAVIAHGLWALAEQDVRSG